MRCYYICDESLCQTKTEYPIKYNLAYLIKFLTMFVVFDVVLALDEVKESVAQILLFINSLITNTLCHYWKKLTKLLSNSTPKQNQLIWGYVGSVQ